MHYKAIGFDYGGVISGLPRSFFTTDVADLIGVSKEEYLEVYSRHNKKVNRNEITRAELWKLVAGDLGKPQKANAALELSLSVLSQPDNQSILDLADTIQAKGYKIGLLTNNTIEAGQKIRDLGVDTHFDVFHNSAETGLVKPEPEAFIYFADELGVKLSELIFIDDSEKSISTAKECGFTPVLFESYEQLVQELMRLDVL